MHLLKFLGVLACLIILQHNAPIIAAIGLAICVWIATTD